MKARSISILLALTIFLSSAALLVSCDDGGKETELPTVQATEVPTDEPTQASTDEPTQVPTDEPTQAPTDEPTQAPTEEPTQAPTEEPTQAPTDEPTQAPTEVPTQAPTEKPTQAPTEDPTQAPTEDPTLPPVEDIIYDNGDKVEGSGAEISENSFSITDFTIDESKAVSKTADEMLDLLINGKTQLAKGEVYIVTEPLVLDSDTKYYGNFAAIIAQGGIVIKDAEEIVIKELLVKGNITVENSMGITFFKLGLISDGIGIDVDASSNDIAVKTCRVIATEIAFKCSASLITCSLNYFSAPTGIVADGDDFAIINSQISAINAGIVTSGKYASIRNCTVSCAQDGVGIDLVEGAYNALVALNTVTDVQNSIRVTKGFNCVVLLNSAISVKGEANTNLYVVENSLGGIIDLKNNNYLLCNANTFNNDGNDHSVRSLDNANVNGDNLHDLSVRAEYGANEELLPHTNKDLFIGMERRSVVRDISQMKSYTIRDYVRALSMSEERIIIAPGVYTVSSNTVLGKVHSNTTLYAYGVYQENTSLGGIYQFNQSENYTVKGLTMGYAHQSSGQAYVLEKYRERGEDRQWHYYVRVVSNAGYINGFGKTDPTVFSTTWNNMFKADSLTPWIDISGNYKLVSKEDDGTILFEISMPTLTESARIYNHTDPGDVWSCRLAGDNLSSVAMYTAKNTTMEDCVMYGYSAALAMSTAYLADGITLHRYHNTTHSGYEIDKETYEKYLALEEKYGVDLEVYVDEYGRYRGGASREGSVDATHISESVRGADATSCIFEGMSDDGSNQRAASSRLAGIVKNEDGKTATVYIKGSIAQTYYSYWLSRGQPSASTTYTPGAGDRIYAYGSGGDIIFDEFTLTAAKVATSLDAIHAIHTACTENNGICSVCGTVTHVDNKPRDGSCDICQAHVHVDPDRNAICDVSGCTTSSLPDADGDQICDTDNGVIITNRLAPPTFNAKEGKLSFDVNYNGSVYTYNTVVYEFTIPAENVNWEAVKKDNLSANSGYFTFDNVVIQNARARGVVCKTVNATIKHCTFRNLAAAGTLMSIETKWGESTVAQDIVVEGCLFENTGYYYDTESDLQRASLSIQGLGELSNSVTLLETTLPCRNITIKGNKFNGTNNNYYIAISAAQNVTIEDNVFCNQPGVTTGKVAKAINIQGCLNVKIEGNTYENGEISEVVIANNYKGLTGSDINGILPTDKEKVN